MSYESRIYNTAIADGMPQRLSDLIVAQSKHESGNYSSNVFRDCNNSFGYSRGGNAPACDGHSFYQRFNTVEDSTHAVCGWILRRRNEGKFPALETITTPEQYAQLLKNSGYYTAPVSEYAANLRYYFNPGVIDSPGSPGGMLAIGFFVGMAILLSKKS